MQKIKVSELSGAALDWAVAVAQGIPAEELKLPSWKGDGLFRYLRDEEGELDGGYVTGPDLLFSRKWEAGGPIIDSEKISTNFDASGRWSQGWRAFSAVAPVMLGETLLIAAMRCYVASKLGDEIEVPEELLSKGAA